MIFSITGDALAASAGKATKHRNRRYLLNSPA